MNSAHHATQIDTIIGRQPTARSLYKMDYNPKDYLKPSAARVKLAGRMFGGLPRRRDIDKLKKQLPHLRVRFGAWQELAAKCLREAAVAGEISVYLFNTSDPIPRLHPKLAGVYRKKVANLAKALNEENTHADAAQAIRGLIEEVRLVPENGTLKIELFGQLAALISLTNKNPRSKETGAQITLVAGARCHLYRTRINWSHSTKPESIA